MGERPRFVVSNRPPVKVDQAKTPYTFGYLEVPENRSRPGSQIIRLPVYIFKSRSENPAPDPVLYTVGGPGSSSLSAAPYMRAFEYLDDRDLILFEQRGTTYAKPNLACPEWTEVRARLADASLTGESSDAAYVQAAVTCRDRLIKENIDLDGYNTREIAADIEDLRKVLDIDQLNLLTISYSTKIAQTMMREYPESLRSVVMDSPLPLAANWDECSVSNLMEVYNTLFQDCEESAKCNEQYPNLRGRFFDYLAEVKQTPIQLQVKDRSGSEEVNVTITSADIFSFLGEVDNASIVEFPQKLAGLLAGDQQMLRDNYYWPVAGPGNGLGMRLSVWCSEELHFADPAVVEEERNRFSFVKGISPLVFSYEVCSAWDVKHAPEIENEAVKSDIPILLISGRYDAVTPVKWARELGENLPNSHQLVFPGWGHTATTYWDNPCAMKVANAFFNQPDQRPDLPCFDLLKAPDFE